MTSVVNTQHYVSNDGRGPDRARIVLIIGDTVHMERWRDGQKNPVAFELPRWFLDSPACGWRRAS